MREGRCRNLAAVRSDRHPRPTRIAGAEMGFVALTAYTGAIDAFLYVLGCREPLPGLHVRYVAARWRQTLGSTMHCLAGDGVGILAGPCWPASSASPGRPR